MKRNVYGTLLACLVCFVLGTLSSGGLVLSGRPADPPKEPKEAKEAKDPVLLMAPRLGANIYLQTSGEYRACCQQIYHLARQRLGAILASANPKPLRPAVVMDLDETVLDNSAFQTFLYQNKLEYSEALWAEFEEKYPQEVTLIPGVKDFLASAQAREVKVVFISNRSEAHRQATAAVLERLLPREDQGSRKVMPYDLYLKAKDGSSDKSARREAAAARYNVLLYFGDNLRDFSESFKAKALPRNALPEAYREAIQARNQQVDDANCHWGVDWFVLPNPVYGEWDKLVPTDPYAILHPTAMKAPGK